MTIPQEQHLQRIKDQFEQAVDRKYRAGVKEHGGCVWEIPTIELIEAAMEEAIDEYVYLSTLRDQIRGMNSLTQHSLSESACTCGCTVSK